MLAILLQAFVKYPAYAQNREVVSLELALLVDVSASVSKEEYRLQLNGLSAAFTSAPVIAAIRQAGGIAVCIIPWAQQAYQYKGIDWTVLRDERDAAELALRIAPCRDVFPAVRPQLEMH